MFNKHNVEFLCADGLLYLSIISEYFRGQEQLAVSSEWRFLRDEKMDRWRVWMLLAQLAHISVPMQLSVADSQSQPFTFTGFQPNKGQPERSLSSMQKRTAILFDSALFAHSEGVKCCSMGWPSAGEGRLSILTVISTFLWDIDKFRHTPRLDKRFHSSLAEGPQPLSLICCLLLMPREDGGALGIITAP